MAADLLSSFLEVVGKCSKLRPQFSFEELCDILRRNLGRQQEKASKKDKSCVYTALYV